MTTLVSRRHGLGLSWWARALLVFGLIGTVAGCTTIADGLSAVQTGSSSAEQATPLPVPPEGPTITAVSGIGSKSLGTFIVGDAAKVSGERAGIGDHAACIGKGSISVIVSTQGSAPWKVDYYCSSGNADSTTYDSVTVDRFVVNHKITVRVVAGAHTPLAAQSVRDARVTATHEKVGAPRSGGTASIRGWWPLMPNRGGWSAWPGCPS